MEKGKTTLNCLYPVPVAGGRVTDISGLVKKAAEIFVVFILVSSVDLNESNSHGVTLCKLTVMRKIKSIVSFES